MSDHRAIVGAVVMLGWVTWLNITANDGSETWSITSATETALQCLAGSEAAVSDLTQGEGRGASHGARSPLQTGGNLEPRAEVVRSTSSPAARSVKL
jgi:hypothetical protein